MHQSNTGTKTHHAQTLAKRSLETLTQAANDLNVGGAGAAVARGRIFELVGYFSEAASSYADALALDCDSDETTGRLAIALLKLGDVSRGLSTAMTLAARNPQYKIKALATEEVSSAMTILGDALVANKRIEDAVEAYEAARKLDSTDTYAAGRLAKLYLAIDKPEKATALAGDLGDNPRFRDLKSLLSLGETSRALLPKFAAEDLIARSFENQHGRPLLVGEEARVAPIVEDSEGWSA